MLKAKKKISKRELKQDTLITTLVKAENFFTQYKQYIYYTAVGVIVLIIVAFVYSNNRKADEEKATMELTKINPMFQADQYETAIKGIPEKNIMGLQKIVNNYGSSESGEHAKIYLANCYYATGKIDEALKYYEDFGGSPLELKAAALAGAASCYEYKKDYKRAAELFEKAGNKYSSIPSASENLINAARNYGLIGDKERAKMLLKKVKTEYPQSTEARDVDRLIALLPS
ncbi:MAG: tetratricopeptide repeat protein [Bacteroidota bacterium]